ncbi:MAG TPA: hypothetical protein VGG14_19800 [Candidatus Sulfotelmatobacter sp.]|jgi:hypothetical protein
MYTGTLIEDLTATVERAEKLAKHKQVFEESDLRRLYELPSLEKQQERIYAGAA